MNNVDVKHRDVVLCLRKYCHKCFSYDGMQSFIKEVWDSSFYYPIVK